MVTRIGLGIDLLSYLDLIYGSCSDCRVSSSTVAEANIKNASTWWAGGPAANKRGRILNGDNKIIAGKDLQFQSPLLLERKTRHYCIFPCSDSFTQLQHLRSSPNSIQSPHRR